MHKNNLGHTKHYQIGVLEAALFCNKKIIVINNNPIYCLQSPKQSILRQLQGIKRSSFSHHLLPRIGSGEVGDPVNFSNGFPIAVAYLYISHSINSGSSSHAYLGTLDDIDGYLKGCRFLPKLNNELPNERNSTYKERFSKLQNLVLIMFEHDTVLIPRETSWFGYFPDGAFSPILPPQQTTLYIEDWIGLKTLDDAGRVKFVSVSGGHLGISRSDMKKYIVPYLEDKTSVVQIGSSFIPRWITSAWNAVMNRVELADDTPLLSSSERENVQ